MDSLKVKVEFPSSMFETRGLVKLGIFSGDELDFFLMVDQLVWKTRCFWNNGLGEIHVHRCKEANGAKKLGYGISIIVSFLNYFASP